MSDGSRESLEVPAAMRKEVAERDGGHCRFCGKYDELLCVHHILYGGDVGMGARRLHRPENLVSLGWSPWHNCHWLVHSNKKLWQPLALQVVHEPGLTMLQLRRWQQRKEHHDG